MTPLLIKSALWVLLFETLQNIPAMVGMIFALSEKTWKKYLYALSGMIVCAFVIAALEDTKLMGTTITTHTAPTLVSIIQYGLEMGIAACIYIFFTGLWKNKYVDIGIGLILAVGISVMSFKANEYWSVRFFSHTIAFSVAVIFLFLLFRKARLLKTLREKIAYIIYTTVIMSVIIAWIDYTPFLKR